MTAIAAAIVRLRSHWTSRFVDTCTIVTTTALGALNPTTLQYDAPTTATVYAGVCLIRDQPDRPTHIAVDGQGQPITRPVVILPHDTPAIPRDAVVTVTDSAHNPQLVGRTYRVHHQEHDAYHTHTVVYCERLEPGGDHP